MPHSLSQYKWQSAHSEITELAAGAQQTGAHWQQQPDAASQALQARLFAYQQQQSQQVQLSLTVVVSMGCGF